MHYKNSYMSLIICLHSRHGSPLRVMPQISQAGGPHGGPLVAREGLTREGDRQTPSWIGWLFGVGLSCIYSIRERWTFLKFCNRRSCLFLEQPKYLGFRAGFEMSSKKQAIFIPLSVCWFILFPSLVFFLLEIFLKKKQQINKNPLHSHISLGQAPLIFLPVIILISLYISLSP